MSDEMISMPVCEHSIPMKLNCGQCGRLAFSDGSFVSVPVKSFNEMLLDRIEALEIRLSSSTIDHIYAGIEKCFERIERIEQHNKVSSEMYSYMKTSIEKLESRFETIDHLIKSSNTAESLFASKVHELKSIDKKRDDVINALCQKVEMLTQRVIDVSPHPLLGKLEKVLDKF
jgi:predicted RNase H-like nuclease (RuvC/YqgF family)